MGRNKQKQSEYDKNRYQELKNNDKNFLPNIAEKRRNERATNPIPHRESTRLWRINHPEQIKSMGRDYCYRIKYGITLKEYNELLEKQNGCCLICGAKTAYKNKGRNLCVDHDHETGKVRGLLCSRCNTTLGHIEQMGIDKVLSYLANKAQ